MKLQPPQNKGSKPSVNSKQTEQPSQQFSEASPFYVANPFRMDDDEPVEEYKLQQKKVLATPPLPPKTSQVEKPEQLKPTADMKLTTKSISNRGHSYDMKKNTSKEWVKLGGLGANIGGDEWQEKKKKQDKMQVIINLRRNLQNR